MSRAWGASEVCHDPDRWDDDPAPRLLRCARIVRRTAQVATFEFVADDRRPLPHVAGQYVTLSARVDGERVSRCYTVSSPPTRPYSVQVTVKREPGGALSPWLHDVLAVGDLVEFGGPAGEFSPALHPGARVLLLAGGVGVTPMISVLEAVHDLADPADVVLLHHSHDPASVVFGPELARIAAAGPAVRAVQAVSVDPTGTWPGPVGRLDDAMLAEHVPDAATREVFVCGPEGYMKHAAEVLHRLGVPAAQVHRESFVLAAPEVPTGPGAPGGTGDTAAGDGAGPADATGHTVTFARSGTTVTVDPGTTVLQAATQAGVRIVTSCQHGLCGTCKVVKLSGEVDMAHQGGIRRREIEAGTILACCSRPRGPVEVDA